MEYQKWSNFCGKVTIFKNEYEDGRVNFSTCIGSKNENGEYENMYMPVTFKKTIDVSNLGRDIIAEGFLSFYKVEVKNEKQETIVIKKPKMVIMNVIDDGNIEKFITIDDETDLDDLPF